MTTEAQLKGGYRVGIEKEFHQLYKDLTEKSTKYPETAPFYVLKDVFLWAVALGVKAGKRRPLKKREPIFRWEQLSTEVDVPALMAIAIAESGDIEVIANQDELVKIAEEFANEGIHELKRELHDQPGQPLWKIVNLLRQKESN
jgi:dnd system-associated protein 4